MRKIRLEQHFFAQTLLVLEDLSSFPGGKSLSIIVFPERLGLPLDGSEGAGETCIEEDEFGTLTRIVVEGVDLTDPGETILLSGSSFSIPSVDEVDHFDSLSLWMNRSTFGSYLCITVVCLVDLKPVPSLTGAARIEAFEQNLNDVLLVSQLLIHRLATGHHILQRYQSINAGLFKGWIILDSIPKGELYRRIQKKIPCRSGLLRFGR